MFSESIVCDSMVTLISSDDKAINISRNNAYLSTLLKKSLPEKNNEVVADCIIPINNINSSILKDIVKFMNFYNENPMPEIESPLPHTSKFLEDLGHDFYRDFTKKSFQHIMKIIDAANFMQIEPLLNLMCASIASIIKGKTPSQLTTLFGIDEKEAKEKVVDEGVDLPAPAKIARTSE